MTVDPWQLPGPAALIAALIDDLLAGEQCLLAGAALGEADRGRFRRAAEQALGWRQVPVRLVFDSADTPPETVLRRAAGLGLTDDGEIADGVWWVEEIALDRAADWARAAGRMAERHRGLSPERRPLLVALLPAADPPGDAFGVRWRGAAPFTRTDLEIAARRLTFAAGAGLAARLRRELAIELASRHLPAPAALGVLEHWLAAPAAVATCETALCAAAGAIDPAAPISAAEAARLLWQVQHQVLGPAIEAARLGLITATPQLWRVPYQQPLVNGRPPKCITRAEMLELSDLVRQLGETRRRGGDALRDQLDTLRQGRNALAHIQPLPPAEAGPLLTLLDRLAAEALSAARSAR